ncbi:MAG: hypothetical protein JXX14_00405, partial [Deltaproteobacteria bacterium]|nr:hypothetical protein [Deltaproteobacteria bacterium]
MIYKNWIWAIVATLTLGTASCSNMLDDINTEADTTTATSDTGSSMLPDTDSSSAQVDGTETTSQPGDTNDSAAGTDTTSNGDTSSPTDTGTSDPLDGTETTSQSDDTNDSAAETDTTSTGDTSFQKDTETIDSGDSATATISDSGSDDTAVGTDTTDSGTDTTTPTESETVPDTEYVCTQENCSGSCYTCINNECQPVAAGLVDPAGICQDQPDNVCGTNGNCDGKGNCQLKKAPNAVCEYKCEDGYENVYTCNPDSMYCDKVQTHTLCELGCTESGTMCQQPCTSDASCDSTSQFCCTADLADAAWCVESGNCVPRLAAGSDVPAGATGSEAYRCASGVSADGICCADEGGCAGA